MVSENQIVRKGLRAAFTRLELTIIVLVSGLVALPMLVSGFGRTKARSQRIRCADNLKGIGLAFKTWALDHGDTFSIDSHMEKGGSTNRIADGEVFQYFGVLLNQLARPTTLICPADVRLPAQDLSASFSNCNLSYFFGLDAVDTNPQAFLCGDRNLTNGPIGPNRILVLSTNYPAGWTREMHRYQGNIGLADGSVQQYSSRRLEESVAGGGRLAMP